MTCINALVRSDCVHVMTDGEVCKFPDGLMTQTRSRVHVLAHTHAVIAVRGSTYFAQSFTSYLDRVSLTGFDDLLSKVKAAARFTIDELLLKRNPDGIAATAKLIDLTRADIVIAGWSHDRGCGETYKLDTSQLVWALEPQGAKFMMPGDNFELYQSALTLTHGVSRLRQI